MRLLRFLNDYYLLRQQHTASLECLRTCKTVNGDACGFLHLLGCGGCACAEDVVVVNSLCDDLLCFERYKQLFIRINRNALVSLFKIAADVG